MIEYLDAAAHKLWEGRYFADAADIMMIASRHASGEVLNAILNNAKMCYFQANNVPKALECIELQERSGFGRDWESQRDKANYLRYLDRYSEAYEIIKNLPDNPTKYLAYSWFLHREGKFREAFEIAERGRFGNWWWGPRKPLNLPLWDGEKTSRIVIAGESGSGDEIIFARWIPLVKQYCNEVYYYTNSNLRDVFVRNFDIQVYDAEIHRDCVMIPCMSIPYVLGLDNPAPVKYIVAKDKPKSSTSKKKIGLCFHGEKTHIETNLRTIPFDLLINSYSLLGELVCLQKDTDYRSSLLNYYPMNTWEDTVSLIDECDLVVSCDTSISHLAAAMGKPTIVLMHAAAYFTWNHNEKIGRSNWYDNAWCVHQTEPCKWEGCVAASVELAVKLLADLK